MQNSQRRKAKSGGYEMNCIPDSINGYSRYSSCIKKISHLTEEDAKMSLQRIRSRGEMKPLHVYFCPFCFHWHVGGCEENDNIRIIDGLPFRHVSTQKSPEDMIRYKLMMLKKGYQVRVRSRQNKARTKRRYQIYVYKPEENQ